MRLLFSALILLVLSLVSGCRSCGRSRVLAEVTKTDGQVQRDTAAHVGAWTGASIGAKLELGDGLRTGASSKASARLAKGGRLELPSETTIRFLESAPNSGEQVLRVDTGQAFIEATDGPLSVLTSIGVAQIEAGGRIKLTAGADGQRLEVMIGRALLETGDGGVHLAAGGAVLVSVGGAIIEQPAEDAGASSVDAGVEAVEPAPEVDADAGLDLVAKVGGAGVRRRESGARAWTALAPGEQTLASGDTIDVPSGVRVDVRRGAWRSTLVGAGQYVVGKPDGPLVNAVRGRVEVDATTEDVTIQVPGGTIVARSSTAGHSRADINVGARGSDVAARQGRVELHGKTGTEVLRDGENATLMSVGSVDRGLRTVERADFVAVAGESFTVHDPSPPTAVGLDFKAACKDAGVLSIGRATVRGEGHAAVLLPAGSYGYSVRCIGADGVEEAVAAKGTVSVVADSGRAELPRSAPATNVDTDGRRYTVLYQNHLPKVIVRWPEAPRASGYTLHIDSGGGASRTISTAQPSRDLGVGVLAEGTHTLWFETADGAKRADATTLLIRFDNAAPSASVREPTDRSFKSGDTVRVSGVAVEGSGVSVNGQALTLDDQMRFAVDTQAPPDQTGLAIRLSHPKRGIAYYLRHAGGSR